MTSTLARTHRLLLATAAFVALAATSVASASTNAIDPSVVSTQSGTVWSFLVAHSAKRPVAACYRSTPHPEDSFTCTVVALRVSGLDATLQDNGPVTLFAPTDAGFARLANTLGQKAFGQLMRSPADIKAVLQGLMVPGRFTTADLKARSVAATGRLTLPTLAGGQLELTFSKFPNAAGLVSVAVGSTLQPGWRTYLVGRTTLLNDGAVIPTDMVWIPVSLR